MQCIAVQRKAYVHCIFDPILSRAVWSKTNFSLCLSYDESDLCDDASCSIENRLEYILNLRIIGNAASLISLVLSILVLCRPKLRCPRNYVHINLFISFIFRSLMILLTETATKVDPHAKRKFFFNSLSNGSSKDMFLCRFTVSFFRYSGSTYHMAILAEAIYLVLLLKFPYYNELKGSKFCILLTWTAPILWVVPWIITRILLHNYWCWHSESNVNLILKIPQTIIYSVNVVCAVYIIRILYSKMKNRTMCREKIIKYRRLAKSILIIIPIFGLHFIFFSWVPYLSLFKIEIGPCFETVIVAIETLFNSFQGLVVSIVCCFIHREFRVEFILFIYQTLNKIKFIRSLRIMNSDYFRNLRYSQSRGASIACTDTLSINSSIDKKKIKQSITIDEKNPMITPISNKKLKKSESIDEDGFYKENRKSITGSPSIISIRTESKCCFCLFGDQKNDFFTDPRRKSNPKKLKNPNSGIFNRDGTRKKSLTLSRQPSSLMQTDESFCTLKNLTSIQETPVSPILKSNNSDCKLAEESTANKLENTQQNSKKNLSFHLNENDLGCNKMNPNEEDCECSLFIENNNMIKKI
ncbi:unnamed protein product [Brachionus calyciflorus]|uniref:G-protein coupled receptors family 2 profile 2 domain-containing protein n=1 Tax=Brachionus calyciflorus TaxID=104777 RepID=A0A814HPS7_9BILA|nr:unnamed protein product [Brachionus calyciflorus]